MATLRFTKRAPFNISKSLPKQHLSRACFSTAFEGAQDPRNRTTTEAGTHELGKEERQADTNIDNMSGVTGFVPDTARQGTVKATEAVEDMANLAKEKMDSAWDAGNNKTQKLQDTLVAEADENVIETTEYRSIEALTKHADHDHDYHHNQLN